jgi:hypothetical protein
MGTKCGTWQAALFLGVALCLLESGCGGGSSVPSTPTPVPTGPSITSITVTPNTAIIGTQVQFAATVADLGNEPGWWNGEHRDVHPQPFTYDELTNSGIAAALAVRSALAAVVRQAQFFFRP